MTAAILASLCLLVILCVLGIPYAYDRGYETGRREQRQIINRSLDAIRQQGLAAQRHIDYLYEQAEQRIEGAGEQGVAR